MDHLTTMHIVRRLRRSQPYAPEEKLLAHAAALAATGAFSLTSDGQLAVFDDGKGAIEKARAVDAQFLRAVGFQTGLQPVAGETLMERLDRRMRAMGAGSFDAAMTGDDDGDFPGTAA